MKSIKTILRESLLARTDKPLSDKRLNRRSLRKLNTLLEKKIKVGDNIHKKLQKINSPLSQNLINFLSSDNIKDDATVDYVDYDKKNEKLFTMGYQDQRGNTKERLMKFNKLLSYLGGDLSTIKSYEVEELINHLKTADTSNMKIVDGKDILWAYHCENYDEGETMGSCMRYDWAQSYLQIYTDNPEQVKCLVLLNPENNKVKGRALLWKLDDGTTYMDRVYAINSQYKVEFNTYAEEHDIETSTPSDEVTLENGGDYDEYPYMDTFVHYTPYSGVLSDSDGELYLQDTHGGQSGRNWSEIHQEYLNDEEGCYLEHIDGYVRCDECVMSVNDEWIWPEADDAHEITVGEYSGQYGLTDDIVELYDGEVANRDDDVYELEKGAHRYEYALGEDITSDVHGEAMLQDEAVEITIGEHSGEYGHEDEVYRITSGDYEGEIFHEIDQESFEEYEYEEYM